MTDSMRRAIDETYRRAQVSRSTTSSTASRRSASARPFSDIAERVRAVAEQAAEYSARPPSCPRTSCTA